jgi:hypothetical protein
VAAAPRPGTNNRVRPAQEDLIRPTCFLFTVIPIHCKFRPLQLFAAQRTRLSGPGRVVDLDAVQVEDRRVAELGRARVERPCRLRLVVEVAEVLGLPGDLPLDLCLPLARLLVPLWQVTPRYLEDFVETRGTKLPLSSKFASAARPFSRSHVGRLGRRDLGGEVVTELHHLAVVPDQRSLLATGSF